MSLSLTKRGDIYYIRGTVRKTRCFETTGTSNPKLAEAYRAKREAELYEASLFGQRAVVSFRRAALSYFDFEPRSERTKHYVGRLVDHFGDTRLGLINQAAADKAVERLIGAAAVPSNKLRAIYTPLSAILMHAAKRGWCDHPHFDKPAPPPGKTRWLTPAEAERLLSAASPHLRSLFIFMLCTGARVSEALYLQWSDVDLLAGTAMLRETKNGRDRVAHLPPAALLELANLDGRDGAVFRRDDGEPYAEGRETQAGGQIKTGWAGACRRAQLMCDKLGPDGRPARDKDGNTIRIPSATPHDLRHTWATWFYALSKDFMLLKDEGGWRTLSMVERYAHLMPSELAPQIARVWGGTHPRIATNSVQETSPMRIAAEPSKA